MNNNPNSYNNKKPITLENVESLKAKIQQYITLNQGLKHSIKAIEDRAPLLLEQINTLQRENEYLRSQITQKLLEKKLIPKIMVESFEVDQTDDEDSIGTL